MPLPSVRPSAPRSSRGAEGVLAAPSARVALLAAVALAASGASVTQALADPLRGEQWNADLIRLPDVPPGVDGRGVTVAVLDTGVDVTHPELRGRVRLGPDIAGGTSSGRDANGHGTHVAGIIAAARGNGVGIEGIAPGAEILAVRVLDGEQGGTTGGAAEGIDAAVRAGARVINLSLGPNPDTLSMLGVYDPFARAIQRAVDAGVVVVAAAGNDSLPLCAQPPTVRGILCVESVAQSLRRASYSNYGLRVDLVAPGGDVDRAVVSTTPGGQYGAMAGTSQAAPQVAGAAALLVGLGLRAPEVVDRLKATAVDLGDPGPDLEYGHGLVDLRAALASLRVPVVAAGPVVRAPRSARIATLLRRGLRVRCEVAASGRCTARATERGTTVLRGSRIVPAGAARTVVARPTRAGREKLRRARRLALRLTVSSAGLTSRAMRLRLRR